RGRECGLAKIDGGAFDHWHPGEIARGIGSRGGAQEEVVKLPVGLETCGVGISNIVAEQLQRFAPRKEAGGGGEEGWIHEVWGWRNGAAMERGTSEREKSSVPTSRDAAR